MFHAIYGDEPLARARAAHDDLRDALPRRATQKLVVEGMERLPQLQQDQIGGIHHIVDRAQAAARQPLLSPGGRGSDPYVAQDPGRVAWT